MQITLNQEEIESAIKTYVVSQINIAEGHEIVVDLKAGRGENGYSATLDIVPIKSKTAKAVKKTAVEEPAPAPKAETKPAPKAEKPAKEVEPEPEVETEVEAEAETQVESEPETTEAVEETVEEKVEPKAEAKTPAPRPGSIFNFAPKAAGNE